MDRTPNRPCVNTCARSPEQTVPGTWRSTGKLRVTGSACSSLRVLFKNPLAPNLHVIRVVIQIIFAERARCDAATVEQNPGRSAEEIPATRFYDVRYED